MSSHYRHRRTSTAATPFPTPVEPGEIVANTANRQLAIGDAASATLGQPLALLAVRFFDARAQYAVGDYVVQAGTLYCANTSIVPGAFNATQWDALAAADVNKAYVDAADANLAASTQAGFDQQTTAVAAKVAKGGDTMTGPLNLSGLPTVNAHAANKQYVDQQDALNVSKTYVDNADALKVAKAGDTMTGPLVGPNGTPTAVGVAVGAAGTGMYNTSGALGLSAAGALKLTLSATGITASIAFKQIDGTVLLPAYNFGLENSGLYRKSAANISMSVTQQEVMSWNGTTKTTTTFGPIVLPTDPVNPLEAATKQYVDSKAAPTAATAAEWISNSAPTKMLTPGAVWSAAQWQQCVDASGVFTPNMGTASDFYLYLTAAGMTLANPINMKPGQKGIIALIQNTSGTIGTWGSNWKFPGGVKPVLSVGGAAYDMVSYFWSGAALYCTFNADFR